MEYQFPKKVCKYLDHGIREIHSQELTQELRLSDGMPDVGRILSAWGQCVLRGKEWRSGEISVSGGVMIWVLYAPEDGTQVRTMESWIPFQEKWDLDDETREGTIQVQNLLRYVDARSTSARKIMVRAGIASLGEAIVTREQMYSTAGEVPEGVQVKLNTYPVRLLKEAGEKSFLLDEDLHLPDSAPDPEKLVYYTISPTIQERKMSADKLVFRGNGNLHLLYLCEEGKLHSWDFDLPFSQYAELEEGGLSDAQADVTVCITSMELELDDEGHFRLKCGLLGQYLVSDRQMLELVEDAYSTSGPWSLDMDQLQLPAILEQKQQTVPMALDVNQAAAALVDSVFLPDFPRQQRSWDGCAWQLGGQFKTLYYGEDNALQSASSRWEGELDIAADEGSRMFASVLPGTMPRAMALGDSISLSGDMSLSLQTLTARGLPMAVGMDLKKQEENVVRPSLILRRAGDGGLWDMAKFSGSTVDAIKKVNNLETEPEPGQMLLIPVG